MAQNNILSQTGIQLEQAAYGVFGAAVDNQASSVLGSIFGNTTTDAASAMKQLPADFHGTWNPTPYSAAIASGAGHFDPKSKFLFKVVFKFHPDVVTTMASFGFDTSSAGRDLTFVVKQIDLPKINYEYETVNMYNFKTKVLKSIDYRDLNISFFDDVGDHAIGFMNAYLQALSPISRMFNNSNTNFENDGFAFTAGALTQNTANRTALAGNAIQPLQRMFIEQYYVRHETSSQRKADKSVLVNVFEFINPRLLMMDLADLDHGVSDAAVISSTFDFDGIALTTGNATNVARSTKLATGDMLADSAGSMSVDGRAEGKSTNPFISILSNQASRAVSGSVNKALNKSLGTVAGGALQGAIYTTSNSIGKASKGAVSGAGGSIWGSVSDTWKTSAAVKDSSSNSEG